MKGWISFFKDQLRSLLESGEYYSGDKTDRYYLSNERIRRDVEK